MSLPVGALVADVGCGNGKYLGVNPLVSMLGSDRSHNLISICRDRGHEAMVCDTMRLPYRSDAFDAAISIAVIHHLSTEEHRLRALRELLRVVRPGGSVLVYVWALEQTENTFFHQVLIMHPPRLTAQDLFVPWDMSKYHKNDDAGGDLASKPDAASKFQRYYHVFREGELEALVASLHGCSIDEAYFDHANWCVRLRKHAVQQDTK